MNEEEAAIFAQLVNNPGYAYVTPDGKKLYAVASPDTGMFVFEGEFTGMSVEEVNEFIQNNLPK